MAKLTRVRGFVFNDVIIDNFEFDIMNNIYLIDVTKPATPTKTRYDFIVPKRHGSQTFENRFEDTFIDIVVGVYGSDILERRAKQRRFLELIGTEGNLSFMDEPTLHYKAEIIDAIEVTEGEIFTEISLHFKASYCKYGEDKNILLAAGPNNIYNMGNYKAETLLAITALSNCESIVINNAVNSFTLTGLLAGEVVYVDSAKMIVYKVEAGVKSSVLARFSGKFWQLEKGKSIVTLAGTNYSATVNLKFNDTYIV